MSPDLDFTRYLSRIGLPQDLDTTPTRSLLDTLAFAHVTHIPFENVDVQLGRPISIDLARVQEKLVGSARGGYCFEQNGLFSAVLARLGFAHDTYAARVRWNATGPTPRTHMLNVVALDGARWLVDVGFGGFVPTGAVALVPDVEQTLPLGVFRMVRDGVWWRLQAKLEAGFSDLYQFTEEPHGPVDFEVMNHFTSTHPASRFRNALIVSLPKEDARHALLDDQYVIRGAETSKRTVAPREIPALLRSVFGIDVPDGTTFPSVERAAARASA